MDPLSLLVMLLVVVLIAAVLIWLVDQLGLPHPLGLVVRVVIVLIALIYIVRHAGLL